LTRKYAKKEQVNLHKNHVKQDWKQRSGKIVPKCRRLKSQPTASLKGLFTKVIEAVYQALFLQTLVTGIHTAQGTAKYVTPLRGRAVCFGNA
jgi:hypothetical protein